MFLLLQYMISKILLFLILVQYCNNDLLLPVIEYGNNVPKHITKVIVSGDLPGEILVSSTPQYVEHNAAFLVDTSYLANWRDLKTHLNMKRCAKKTYYFQKIIDQLTGYSSETYMYKATWFIYAHKDYADFHKIIVAVNRFDGGYLPLVYVQCFFEGNEHEVTSNQLFHGNNLQEDKPRQATHFSVREKIRELSEAGM